MYLVWWWWSNLTMFRQDDNFSSRAPTFRSRSLTMLRAEVRADGVRGWLGPYLLAAPPPVESGDDFVDDGGVSSQDSRDSTSSANLLESENVSRIERTSESGKTSRTESAQNCITNFIYTGVSVCELSITSGNGIRARWQNKTAESQYGQKIPISRHYSMSRCMDTSLLSGPLSVYLVYSICRKVIQIVNHNTQGSRYQAGQNLFIRA